MTPAEIEKIFRDEGGRALATLIRLVGDFDLAEDALKTDFFGSPRSERAQKFLSKILSH